MGLPYDGIVPHHYRGTFPHAGFSPYTGGNSPSVSSIYPPQGTPSPGLPSGLPGGYLDPPSNNHTNSEPAKNITGTSSSHTEPSGSSGTETCSMAASKASASSDRSNKLLLDKIETISSMLLKVVTQQSTSQ